MSDHEKDEAETDTRTEEQIIQDKLREAEENEDRIGESHDSDDEDGEDAEDAKPGI